MEKYSQPAYVEMVMFIGNCVSVAEGSTLPVELDGNKYVMAEGETVF